MWKEEQVKLKDNFLNKIVYNSMCWLISHRKIAGLNVYFVSNIYGVIIRLFVSYVVGSLIISNLTMKVKRAKSCISIKFVHQIREIDYEYTFRYQ